MNADTTEAQSYKHSNVTQQVIGAAFRVHKELGHGFLEKVYENALALELAEAGLRVEQQCPLTVAYKGTAVGEYLADIVVEKSVMVEVKAVAALDGVHEAQLLNYLKASGIEVGLLINFGPRVQVKRRVFSR